MKKYFKSSFAWLCLVLCAQMNVQPVWAVSSSDASTGSYVELTPDFETQLAGLPTDLQAFIGGTLDHLRTDGSHTVVLDYWPKFAEQRGFDFTALRTAILESNKGKKEIVKVRLHPDHAPVVAFFNEHLARMKMDDFISFELVPDSSLRGPEKPFVPSEKAFKIMTYAGAVVLPLLCAALAGAGSWSAIQHAVQTGDLTLLHAKDVQRDLAKIFTVIGLETMFRLLAETFGSKWGDERPGLQSYRNGLARWINPFQNGLPKFSPETLDRLKRHTKVAALKLNQLSGFINSVPRGVYNLLTANLLYGGLLVASSLIVSFAIGDTAYLAAQEVASLFWMTIVWGGVKFTSAIGPFQAIFGAWRNRMAITPVTRTLSDYFAVLINSAGRGTSLSYGKDIIGTYFNFGFLGAFGVPALLVEPGLRASSDAVGRNVLAVQGQEVSKPGPFKSWCLDALTGHAKRVNWLLKRRAPVSPSESAEAN